MDIDSRGNKHFCASCNIKFYDFNRLEIICPNCKSKLCANIDSKKGKERNKQIHKINNAHDYPEETLDSELDYIETDDEDNNDEQIIDIN